MSLLRPLSAALLSVALAPSLRSDPPENLHFTRYEDPPYPASLATTKVSDGFATIAFTVDNEGKVLDSVVLAASHPAFGETVLSAIKNWQLAPETNWTSSNNRREVVKYQFSKRVNIATLSNTDALKQFFNPGLEGNSAPIQTAKWAELSTPPTRISSATPQYPNSLITEKTSGTAVVSFIIDTQGNVRVPAVVAADKAEFGEAALAAVKQWKYEPALLNGSPVNVQVERKFNFRAP